MANDNPTPEQIRDILRISCADAGALLSDYHDGALPADDEARVRAHIGGCVPCSVILEQIHTTTMILRRATITRPEPDPAEVERILDTLRHRPR